MVNVFRVTRLLPIALGVLFVVAGAGTVAAQGVPGFDNAISERQIRIGENHIQLAGQVELKRGDLEVYADEVRDLHRFDPGDRHGQRCRDPDRQPDRGRQSGLRLQRPGSAPSSRRTASPTSNRRRRAPAPSLFRRSPARKPTCIFRERLSRRSVPRSTRSRTAASRRACSRRRGGICTPERSC